jgi:hypothetical protein
MGSHNDSSEGSTVHSNWPSPSLAKFIFFRDTQRQCVVSLLLSYREPWHSRNSQDQNMPMRDLAEDED